MVNLRSSEPLYLKYRPTKLSELVGQDMLVKTLSNALKYKSIANAYLLTGPRGCGKTSSARIIAKSLNCMEGMSENPCGKCTNCLEINQGISPDVIEIDAASNRSVDDADSLISRAYSAPSQSNIYKIYILDEVHMLSVQAFNALLKIIEEPPDNVVFIFATTEAHKVLDTIVSRCQRFQILPIPADKMFTHLQSVIAQEKINIDNLAIHKIINLSNGGMRDALSLLDQVSVLSVDDYIISEEDIDALFGTISAEHLDSLLNNILDNNFEQTLQTLNNLLSLGKTPVLIIRNLLEYGAKQLENIILKSPKANQLDNLSKLNFILQQLFEIEFNLHNKSQSDIYCKAAILQLCTPAQELSTIVMPVQQSVQSISPSPASPIPSPTQPEPIRPANIHIQEDIKPETPPSNNNNLDGILHNINSPALKSLIKQSELSIISSTDELIIFGLKQEKETGFLSRLKNKQSNLETLLNKKIDITIINSNVDIQEDKLKPEQSIAQDSKDNINTSILNTSNQQPSSNINTSNAVDIHSDASNTIKIVQEYLGGKLLS